MAGQIPKDFISNLLARTDIVEIVGARLQLRKMGSNFAALCPFHTEKTPSFTVSPAKQFFYCFGCGAHGTALQFLMQFDRLDFLSAVEFLASQLGLEIPYEHGAGPAAAEQAQLQTLYTVLLKAAQFYQKELVNSSRANNYLTARGIAESARSLFMLGYAPPRREALLQNFANDPETKNQLLLSGVIKKRSKEDNYIYETFHDRVIFPIRDRRGRVVAFGGRSFGNEHPKYLNSPETPVFHKGNELYGLYEARSAKRKLEQLIVVEGYLDVIALAQYGIDNAVATMGTAIGTRHLQLLLREVSDIVFCFDGDSAGQNAAWRALELTLPMMRDGIKVRFLFLPEKDDPDSYVRREGQIAFLRCIETSLSLPDFFFKKLSSSLNLNNIDGRAALARVAQGFIEKMPNGVFKHLMLEKLAKLIRVDVAELATFTAKKEDQMGPNNFTRSVVQLNQPTHKALHYLLLRPELALEVINLKELDAIPLPDMSLLIWLLKLLQTKEKLSLEAILETCKNDEIKLFLAELAMREPLISLEGLKNEFLATIKQLSSHNQERAMETLFNKARQGSLTAEERQLLQEMLIKYKASPENTED